MWLERSCEIVTHIAGSLLHSASGAILEQSVGARIACRGLRREMSGLLAIRDERDTDDSQQVDRRCWAANVAGDRPRATGRSSTRSPAPVAGTASTPDPRRHRAIRVMPGPAAPTGAVRESAPAADSRAQRRGAHLAPSQLRHEGARRFPRRSGNERCARQCSNATAKDGRHDRRRGDASGSSRRWARAGGPTARRVATPGVEPRRRDRREPLEHDSRTASGAAGRPAGGSPGVRPRTRGSCPTILVARVAGLAAIPVLETETGGPAVST